MVIQTEPDRTRLIRARLIDSHGAEVAVQDGTDRGELVRRMRVAAAWWGLAHERYPLVEDGGDV